MIFQRWAQQPQHAGCRRGFTLLEILFVLMIAVILMSMSIPGFTRYLRWRAVVSAQEAFGFAAARARVVAVERGRTLELVADPATEKVAILNTDGTPAMDSLNLAADRPIDLVITEGVTRVCYVPRGYAGPDCSSGLGRMVGFTMGGDTAWSRINGLGQVDHQ